MNIDISHLYLVGAHGLTRKDWRPCFAAPARCIKNATLVVEPLPRGSSSGNPIHIFIPPLRGVIKIWLGRTDSSTSKQAHNEPRY
jgi:hypothetical protein